MPEADRYRELAADCERRAQAALDGPTRNEWRQLAATYRQLASRAGRPLGVQQQQQQQQQQQPKKDQH